MKKARSVLAVGALLSLLGGAVAAHADVAAEYMVNQSSLKKGARATDSFTFTFYENSACTDLVSSQVVAANDLTYEQLKLVALKGGDKPTAATIITTTIAGSNLVGPLYLKVEGPGVEAVGGDCQLQKGAEPFQSKYIESSSLNNSSVEVSTTWTKMDDFIIFTKARNDTKIEVVLNSRILGGSFAGATGIRFQIEIDGSPASVASDASIAATNTRDFVSMTAIFEGLAAGNHVVSVWARTNLGTSSGVLLDPGGWGGRLIVKETF